MRSVISSPLLGGEKVYRNYSLQKVIQHVSSNRVGPYSTAEAARLSSKLVGILFILMSGKSKEYEQIM